MSEDVKQLRQRAEALREALTPDLCDPDCFYCDWKPEIEAARAALSASPAPKPAPDAKDAELATLRAKLADAERERDDLIQHVCCEANAVGYYGDSLDDALTCFTSAIAQAEPRMLAAEERADDLESQLSAERTARQEAERRLAEAGKDTERLNWLAELTEGVQKVHIEPLGWIYLDRAALDSARAEGATE